MINFPKNTFRHVAHIRIIFCCVFTSWTCWMQSGGAYSAFLLCQCYYLWVPLHIRGYGHPMLEKKSRYNNQVTNMHDKCEEWDSLLHISITVLEKSGHVSNYTSFQFSECLIAWQKQFLFCVWHEIIAWPVSLVKLWLAVWHSKRVFGGDVLLV